MKIKKLGWEFIFSYLMLLVVLSQILFPLKINIYIANLFLYLFIAVYFLYFLMKREAKFYFNEFMALYFLFTLWSFFSVLWSIDADYTFPIAKRIAFLFLTLFVIYNVVKRFNNELYILYGILIGAYFNYLIALEIIEYTTPFTNNLRFTGTLARSNDVAIVMIISLISSFILLSEERVSPIWRKIALLNIPLALYVIFLTVSKKGIVFGASLTLIYFIYEIRNNPKKFVATIAVIGASIYFILKDNEILLEKFNTLVKRFMEFDNALKGSEYFGSTAERLRFIEEGIEFFSNHPIIGTGLNTFIVQDSTHHYSHNNYIEILVGLGIVGFFIYYAIHFRIFSKLLKLKTPTAKRIRLILLFSLMVFIFMDSALVSYGYKIVVIMLFFLSIYIDKLYKKG